MNQAAPADADPLILTLALDADDQARFQALRQRHFPAERNLIPAHLTLFHHLPGTWHEVVSPLLLTACAVQQPFLAGVTGLRSLGRGVAFTLQSPELSALRAALARQWHDSLTPQDRQGWRPHITIQNKVTPEAARALLQAMQAAFTPFTVRANGLRLWRYLGGPWQELASVPFTKADPGPQPPR